MSKKNVSTKLIGIGLLSAGCLVAASAGGYVAVRENVAEAAEAVLPVPLPNAGGVVDPSSPAATAELTGPVPEPASPKPATTERPAKVPMSAPAPEGRTAEATRGRLPQPAPVPAPTMPEPLPQADSPAFIPMAGEPVPLATPAPPVVTAPRYVPDFEVPPAAAQLVPLEELVLDKHSVIGIRLAESVSTKTAQVEDRVTATISRDVTVGERTAIAAGVEMEGTVVVVEHGGRFKNRARIGLRFDRIILADGTRIAISTDTIYREGDSPAADATAKVGTGTVVGAILGGLLGGKKGAAIGSAAGALGGAATVMKGDEGEVILPAGAPLTVRLDEELTIIIR